MNLKFNNMKKINKIFVFVLLFLVISCNRDDNNGGNQDTTVTKTELTEKAIVLSQEEASTDIVKFSGNSMIIKAKSSYGKYANQTGKTTKSKPLEVGSILTCEPTNLIPDGMLIEVTSISPSNDAQYGAGYNYVEFQQSKIEDLLKNLIKTEDTKSLEAKLIENEGGVTSTFNGNKINLEVSKNISVKEKVGNDSIEINGKLTGNVEFSKDYKLGLEINERKLQYFALAMTSKDNLNLKFEGSVTGKKTKEIKLCTVQGKPIIFQLGPVPVTVTPIFEVKIELEMSGKVNLKMTLVKYDKEYTHGVKYNNGTWSTIDYSLPKDDTNNDFSIGLQGKIKATLEAEFTGKFYGGLAYLGVYGNAFAEISDRANIGESLKADLTLGYALGVKTGIKLWSKTLSTEFSYEPVRGEYKKSIIDLIAGNLNVPTYGLVAYYPFNGNANDESGFGNNGIVNGATLTTDKQGNSNKAYSFDGIDDFIKVENSYSLQNIGNEITISAWVFANQYSVTSNEYIPILEKNNSQQETMQFYLGYDKTVSKLYSGNNGKTHLGDCPLITLNNWHHIVVVYSNTSAFFYIDGIKYNSTQTYNVNSNNTLPLIIGQNPAGLNEVLNGKLDNIRIYNRALTNTEVQALYNE